MERIQRYLDRQIRGQPPASEDGEQMRATALPALRVSVQDTPTNKWELFVLEVFSSDAVSARATNGRGLGAYLVDARQGALGDQVHGHSASTCAKALHRQLHGRFSKSSRQVQFRWDRALITDLISCVRVGWMHQHLQSLRLWTDSSIQRLLMYAYSWQTLVRQCRYCSLLCKATIFSPACRAKAVDSKKEYAPFRRTTTL